MKNKIDSRALQLLREYFRLPASRELQLDLQLCNIDGCHAAINFCFYLEDRTGFQFTDEQFEKITVGTVKKYLSIYKKVKRGA
jgi:hypothetical protein